MPNAENLGPADRIINTVLAYSDHMYHGRPGMVVRDPSSVVGVTWFPVTLKKEGDVTTVNKMEKVFNRKRVTPVGQLRADNKIYNGTTLVGEYRTSGLFPEVVAWTYSQIAEVWKLDNEFVARWASYAFTQEHRDLKVVLAAFMLVQNRFGEPIKEGNEVLFYDENYRDVGEAMILLRSKNKLDLNPKLLLRVGDVLNLPAVAQMNRELGFGHSDKNAFMGRWTKAITKWLRHREQNKPLLQGLVKSGFKRTTMELARRVGYKPESADFFETLGWKQSQAKDGRRTVAIGLEMKKPESWAGLNEEQVCEKIAKDKPDFKRIIGMLPREVGLTKAVLSVAIESGSLSNKDLIIYTPMLEEFGLLTETFVKTKWEQAVKEVEDFRAAHVATRVRNKEAREALKETKDAVLQKAAEEVTKGLKVYFMVDCSGSMDQALETAKGYISKFLQAFPKDQIHISVFNTAGREVILPHHSEAGVNQAFRGLRAGGGTDYSAGVIALQHHKPKADEDVLFVFVGDEGASDFHTAVQRSELNPVAFGLIKVTDPRWPERRFAVQNTAKTLNIPCINIDESIFNDAYAVPRTIRNLIAATPVRAAQSKRESLIDVILKTKLLKKPVWAEV